MRTLVGAWTVLLAFLFVAAPAAAEPSFVGSSKCKKCHIKEFKSWAKNPLASSFESLKPDVKAAVKERFKLDPKKDYSTDQACLKCHTTGMGKAGGYKAGNTAMEGVGCESCHGAGSDYLPVMEAIMKEKRKYKVAELVAVGFTPPSKEACATCHSKESPTFTVEFDYAKAEKEGSHERFPLQLREP